MHEAPRNCGIGAEIAATVAEHGLYDLHAPIKRVTGYDTVMPLFKLEHEYIPSVARIVDAVRETLSTDPGRFHGAAMTTFHLPDLGEGLAEAEIVRWHVKVGDQVKVDQPMLAVETAKAVVEVPAPYSGIVTALHGKPGDVIATGAPLVEFIVEGELKPQGGSVGRVAATRTPAQPRSATQARSSAACRRATRN